MGKVEEVEKLTEKIIQELDKFEDMELPLFQATLVKNDGIISNYLGDKVIGFYFYNRVSKLHFIKSIFDGCDYKIQKSSLEPFERKNMQ